MFIARTPDPGIQSLESRLESRTRDRVLKAISEHGPIRAAALAEQLGLTPTAVRRHLDNLVDDGLIEVREQASGHRRRGRPARSYVISPAGHQALVSDYDHLATEALRFLEQTGGSGAVSAFVQQRVASAEERYAAELAGAGDSPSERAEALVRALNRDGFAASARPMGGSERENRGVPQPGANPVGPLTGIQLCQGHCPVQHAAREFPQFCDAETDAFSRLLGVHVQRLATLAHGDHVCTTFVPAVPAAASPAVTTTTTATTTASATTKEGSTR